MIIIKFLITGLFAARLFLIKNKSYPIVAKLLQWIIVILFSFVWGVGGFIDYPFLASLAGFIIIHFWLFIICVSIYRVFSHMKMKLHK